MDGKRFDQLTRALASPASRRTALKGLLGLGGVTIGGSAATKSTDARTLRTRNTIPPAPEPGCPLPNQLCGGECCGPDLCKSGHCCSSTTDIWCGGQCWPGHLCTTAGVPCDESQQVCGTACCPAGASCARSGNADICCDPNQGQAPCGLDCCASAAQCCDLECCADGTVCIGEGYCCPLELMCGGVCCNGDGQSCCGDRCLEPGQCCSDAECPDSPSTCQQGYCDLSTNACALTETCTNAPGMTCCDGNCVSLGTIERCLGCDDACDAGEVCCNDGCATLGTDAHCSACGDACQNGFACIDGQCRCDEDTDCEGSLVCCDNVCLECCGSDASSCSDNPCEVWSCNSGQCELAVTLTCTEPAPGDCYDAGTCNPDTGLCENREYLGNDETCGSAGQFCCNGFCISSDTDSCGSCDTTCRPGFLCIEGECQCDAHIDCAYLTAGCEAGRCEAGACVTVPLTGGEPCAGQDGICNAEGDCVIECSEELPCLSDACVTRSCIQGRCEIGTIVLCPAIGCMTQSCDPEDGLCKDAGPIPDGASCSVIAGSICCEGRCVGTSTDPDNCGACGNVCDEGFDCQAGVCTCSEDDHCDDGMVCCEGACKACCNFQDSMCPDPSSDCVTSLCTGDVGDTCVEEPKADLTECFDSNAYGVCASGTCTAGCAIDGTFYPQGEKNPASLCQYCDPFTSRTSWTTRTCDIIVGSCTRFTCDPADGVCKEGPAGDGTTCSVTSAFPNACSTQGTGTCQNGQCVVAARNEGVECGTASTSCQRLVCRAGICTAEAANEGSGCIDTSADACHWPNGTCRAGVCDLVERVDGTPCDTSPLDCIERRCQGGTCIDARIREGELCNAAITQCRSNTVCGSDGACVTTGVNPPSFCTDTGLSYCEEFRLTEGGACNGDGTCTHYGTFENGQVRCEGLGYSRECCPGMVCECPPQSGSFCVEKFCYYP